MIFDSQLDGRDDELIDDDAGEDVDSDDTTDLELDELAAWRRTPQRSSAAVGEWLDQQFPPSTPGMGVPTVSPGLVGLITESIAPSTRAAYEGDWQRFATYCEIRGLDPIDIDPVGVAEYVVALTHQRLSPATIDRRIASIRYFTELVHGQSPTTSVVVRRAVAGARRVLGSGKRQAAPLLVEDLRRIVAGWPIVAPNRPSLRRDQTLLALGWAGALRSAELVGLDLDDLSYVGDPDRGDGGVIIRLRDTKTSAGGVQYVAVPYSSHWSTCPVRKLLAYTRGRRSGPVFLHIDRHGRTHHRLRAASVTAIVRRGITDVLHTDAAPYSSHSLRAGFVTTARQHGVDDHLIARHTRHHRANLLDTYDRPTTLLQQPALEAAWW